MNTNSTIQMSEAKILDLARGVIRNEAQAVAAMERRLDGSFVTAIELMIACRGRVVVSGMGKSGHVARKIAATMASTGTPAFFVHPAEASHGDLGMITADDLVIALSYSGESDEILAVLPAIRRKGARLIAITGASGSSLARFADVHLDASVEREACPLGLAPSASTTVMLALGDALAFATLDARGFSAEDFALSHPAGALGRRLLVRVSDLMHSGDRLPSVAIGTTLAEALREMSKKSLGMTGVVDQEGKLVGIFTDGDLRRLLEQGIDFRTAKIETVMKAQPKRISGDRLAVEAVKLMDQYKINGLLVVDERERLIGALNMHDLFRAKIV